MQKLALIATGLALLVACQKSDNSLNRVSETGLLVKQVDKTGQDSMVTEYFYDASDRLIEEKTRLRTVKYTRNQAGKIINISSVGRLSDLSPVIDTIVVDVIYKQNGLVDMLGDSSIQYIHDGLGRITRTNYFAHSGDAEPDTYGLWSYDGSGNLHQIFFYKKGSLGTNDYNIAYAFEYDNKLNPLLSADQVLLPFKWGLAVSPNNVTRQVTFYGANNPVVDQNTIVYQYKSTGVPEMAEFNSTAVQGTKYTTYYYQ